jgi:hypothetical protein
MVVWSGAANQAKRDINLAALFDLAAGEHAQTVGVQQQRNIMPGW